MKKWIIIAGIVLIVIGLLQTGSYIADYNSLTHYGKGYVWGSGFLLLLGIILIIVGFKKKKAGD